MKFKMLSVWGISKGVSILDISEEYRKLALAEAKSLGHYKCPNNLWERLHTEFPKLTYAECKKKKHYKDKFFNQLKNDIEEEISRLSKLYGSEVNAQLRKKNELKPISKGIASARKGRQRIGLGLESQVVIPKVRAEDVVIDKHTNAEMVQDKHILYAAGWSLEGAFTK
ncbi:hypothetical protein [Vibrio breoganii]|uniref:hypothetical protein n=1 Tax=Vibrio breoganii TaxID=553239 RepID=UPI0003607A3D|nr:hypothetical protein [Vibrio breoganii]OED82626.1 hypothetical protein A1QE_15380 [Vibrio breoganii ZF-55]